MKLAVGIPTHNEGVAMLAAKAVFELQKIHRDWQIELLQADSSLLTYNMNRLWYGMLNMREQDTIDHFLLLHADIRPLGKDWMDLLLQEMSRAKADIVAAIPPIKDNRGLTSTAIDTDPWRPCRLTQHQVNRLPLTWTSNKLLFNTGLMLVNLAGTWMDKICFTINDKIVRSEYGWTVLVEPEDWNFSRQCRVLGVRAFVTKAVAVDHLGEMAWCSSLLWGHPREPDSSHQPKDDSRLVNIQTPEGQIESFNLAA